MQTNGVELFADVSEHQGAVDYAAYKASGCNIIGYKISEGRTYLDRQAIRNRDLAITNGLRGLAYHFAYWSSEYDAHPELWAEQTEFFLSYAPPNHAHCLDVEMLAPAGSYIHVRELVNAYRVHYATHPLLVYSNRGLWVNRSKVPYDGPVGTLLWHAGYRDGYYTPADGTLETQWHAVASTTNSMVNYGYPECQLWQFTDHARVPGIAGLCDGNAFIGSLADWDRLYVTGGNMATLDADDRTYLETVLVPKISSAVHSQRIYRQTKPDGTPLNIADALLACYKAIGTADELSPAALASVTAAVQGLLTGLPDALAAKLTSGLSVDGVDYDRVKALIDAGMDEHVANLRLVQP